MNLKSNCMECQGEPEEFESSTGDKAYWMVTVPGDYSPIRYTSDNDGNLELNFIVGPDKEYVPEEGEIYMCIKCYERIHNSDEID